MQDNYTMECRESWVEYDFCEAPREVAAQKVEAAFLENGIRAADNAGCQESGAISFGRAAHLLISRNVEAGGDVYLPDGVMSALCNWREALEVEDEDLPLRQIETKIHVLRDALFAGELALLAMEEAGEDPGKRNRMIRVNKAIQEKIRAMGKRQADALRRGSDEETFFRRAILTAWKTIPPLIPALENHPHTKAPIIPTVVIFTRSREYRSPSRRSSSSSSGGGGDGGDDSGGSDPEPPASFVVPSFRNILSQNTHHAMVHGSQEGGRC